MTIDTGRTVEEGALFIDGFLYRKVPEPRLVADCWFQNRFTVKAVAEAAVHGEKMGLSRSNDYKPPYQYASFRADRLDDLLAYLDARDANVIVNVDVSAKIGILMPEVFTYDDERDTLVRTAQWIVTNDLHELINMSRADVIRWCDLRDASFHASINGSAGNIELLQGAVDSYRDVCASKAAKEALADLAVRQNAAAPRPKF